ncbi:MAG: hypothetical protein B5M49_03240 [Thermotoga sp. 4484_232]|nr:MAG: hypothetical protein B5M49_03240 [Thermotoga sp. 4484_232]
MKRLQYFMIKNLHQDTVEEVIEGVLNVDIVVEAGVAGIEYDDNFLTREEIVEKLRRHGFEVLP